jgi:hypothetical protein
MPVEHVLLLQYIQARTQCIQLLLVLGSRDNKDLNASGSELRYGCNYALFSCPIPGFLIELERLRIDCLRRLVLLV